MAVTKKTPLKTAKKTESTSKDYIELRIPRLTFARLPMIVVIPLILLAFLLGMFRPRLLGSEKSNNDSQTNAADVASAFAGYADEVGIDRKKFESCYASKTHQGKVDEDTNTALSSNVNATPTFFINGQQVVGALPFEVFKARIDNVLTGSPLPTLAPNEPTPGPVQDVAVGHLPVRGNKNASVTVIEFSDFQCPFCEQFYKTTYPQLKKEYIDTGKIAFYYRHFPLTNIHPLAVPAANASECANEQGKFWEYHDLLFQNQTSWASLPLTAPTE